MSKTPRTDAEIFFADVKAGETESVVTAEFARKIELELTTLRENLERVVKRSGERIISLRKVALTGNGLGPLDYKADGMGELRSELRRVLSGETPPEPGVEWPEEKETAV